MASKNKKAKEPGADKGIFNMVRDYCKPPWVSTNKELPESNRFVLLAYYGGEDVGYRMTMGWLYKHVIKEREKKNTYDYFAASSYFAKTINVNDSDSNCNYKRDSLIYPIIYEREDNIASKYEIIEEDGKKIALMWFVYVVGDSPGIFQNSKSADSTFRADMNLLQSEAKEYTKPDFWMYVPGIK